MLCLLASLGRTVADPTHTPPPPIRAYQTVPPPPSPPPGLIASFSPGNDYSTAQLGSWEEGQGTNPRAGILVAQATDTTVSVYGAHTDPCPPLPHYLDYCAPPTCTGVLSGLTPNTNLTSMVTEAVCQHFVTFAGAIAVAIAAVTGSDGAVIIEGAQTTDGLGSTLTEESAKRLARVGFAGVYDSVGKLLMCQQLEKKANTQVVLIGRMPSQFNQRTAQGFVLTSVELGRVYLPN